MTTWARWFEEDNSRERVARDEVGVKCISTVFLGLDHGFMPGDPVLLYETMVFPDPNNMLEELCRRYTTRAEAERGHAEIVASLRAEHGSFGIPPVAKEEE